MVLSERQEVNLKNHIENIAIRGYALLENVISKDDCKIISDKLDFLEESQRKEYGIQRLQEIHEIGIVRAPMEKDDYFMNLILNPSVFGLVSSIIRDTAILHLQNGVILEPEVKHGQGHFHRDLTFLNFISDKVLSLSALWVIDDFNSETGGTWVVPFTHKLSDWPSDEYLERNAVQITAEAGSVIVFDSMLIHKGGSNKSNKRRRAVNHMYTRPFIKQQIDFPSFMKGRYDMESKMSQVLGFWSVPPKGIKEYRSEPDKRSYRSGQG